MTQRFHFQSTSLVSAPSFIKWVQGLESPRAFSLFREMWPSTPSEAIHQIISGEVELSFVRGGVAVEVEL